MFISKNNELIKITYLVVDNAEEIGWIPEKLLGGSDLRGEEETDSTSDLIKSRCKTFSNRF